ncbi:transposase [Leisingera sp.]|uniref:transposase n=1 Tax=Leisingera sp. TaxID=1879318 RepID=UPI003A5BE359
MDRKKNTTSPYPAEFRERAVQMVIEHLDGYRSLTAAVRDIAGKEAGPTSAEKTRIKKLERENRELRQANEILKKASACFAQAELDRPFRK